MKKQFIAAAVLAMSAMTGVAQADLATDLTLMPASEALAKAVQTQGVSVESLIADAAAQLANNPQLLNALVSEAVRAYPDQAPQIVYAAVQAAPAQKATITRAATAQLANDPVAQQAVQQAADVAEQQVVQGGDTGSSTETVAEQGEFEAENTEVEAPAPEASTPPPPPPPASGGSNDKPTSPVSPS
ncbi:hypothetical protein [Salinisphaera sp. G21_0]|uniref:hypothetical protein n=1 Tax=Salinisphaera sp. G21_0 TaxID=2821094 RepID=UPI001ADC9E90|nr:hypothetical protein [Salinisphaera sp. G21_0]MBO9483071.1 hypothetical protein [Salinisphaera sp. G21_0]